jgi:hypothetical protein
MNENISWNRLYKYRKKIQKCYPKIWNLKLLRKRFPLILEVIQEGDKVLDIGASNRYFEPRIKDHFSQVNYKSLDVDRSQFHDFYSLDEVHELFDVVLLIEVIEHLELEKGLILTTPNIYNPNQFWKDATHKVAYCYDELGGILLGEGFKIDSMYRTYNDAFHRFFFRVYIMAPMHRYLGIDFTKSILIVAHKEFSK